MKLMYKLLLFMPLVVLTIVAQAQMKVGNNPIAINSNAVFELESTNKGMLLPRVALTATNNVAPLTAHAAGMVVYNTATAGTGTTAVVPGYYYNNGSGWLKIAQEGSVNLASLSLSNSTTPAGSTLGQIAYNSNAASGLPVGPVYWNGTNWIPVSSATGTVTNVTGTAPISVATGTTTPVISLNDAGVTTAKIADNAVTTAKIADASITTAKIADGAVVNADIAAGAGGIYKGSGSLSGATTVTQGANALTFDGAGSLIKLNGNVGIGTAAPTSKLDVALPGGSYIRASGNDGDLIGGFGYSFYIRNTNHEFARINGEYGDSNAGGAGGISFSTLYYGDLSKRMFIAPAGKVGIGTTDPYGNLHVNSASATTIRLSSTSTTDDRNQVVFGKNGKEWNIGTDLLQTNADNFYIWQEGPGAGLLINEVGNVGIGTNAPTSKLHVGGTMKVETPGSDAQRTLLMLEPNTWATVPNMQSSYLIRAGEGVKTGNAALGAFAVRGDGQGYFAGNVGIGTSAPAAKLDVNGYIKLGSSDGLGDITPEPGMIRFSNTTNKFQGYVGGSTNAWVDLN